MKKRSKVVRLEEEIAYLVKSLVDDMGEEEFKKLLKKIKFKNTSFYREYKKEIFKKIGKW